MSESYGECCLIKWKTFYANDIKQQRKKIDFQIIFLNFLLLAKLELVKVVYCITSSKVNVSEI